MQKNYLIFFGLNLILLLSLPISGFSQFQYGSKFFNPNAILPVGYNGINSQQIINSNAVQSASPGITDHNDIPIFPKGIEQSETHISINNQNPNILVVSANTFPGIVNQGRYVSTDGGLNWTGSDMLNSNFAKLNGDPSTAIDASGNIYISTINENLNGYYITKSIDNGTTFGPLVNAFLGTSTFDKEMIATDYQTGSSYKNYLYCAWMEATGYDQGIVEFNHSTNGGSSFLTPTILKNGAGQGTNVQTGPNGEVYVCYADYGSTPTFRFPANGLGFVISTNGGASFSPAQVVVPYVGIRKSDNPDPLFNNIGVNDFPSMAVDKSAGGNNARIYAVFAAQQNGNGKAVIELTWSDNRGGAWSAPKIVSIPNGSESFFPWVTVDQATGGLYIAYFSIDGGGFQTNTYLAISNDGGNTIVNQQVSDVPHITQPINNNEHRPGYEGDYIGVAAYGGKAYVSWMDERSGIWQAYVSEVDNIPTPIVSGTITAFCTSATFNATNVPTGKTVTWSASPSGVVNLSPSGNQVTVTKVSEGYVTLTATLSSGAYGILNITTQPDVSAISSAMSGPCASGYQTWYVSATPNMAGATNWQWTVQYPINGTINIFSPYSQSTYVSVTGGGKVLVTYTDQCGETSKVEGVTIYSPCTMGAIVAYPNPADNQLTVQNNIALLADPSTTSNSSSLATANFSVELFNAQGQVIKSGQTANGSQSIVLNTSDMNNGTYYLHILQSGETIEQQIIIKH